MGRLGPGLISSDDTTSPAVAASTEVLTTSQGGFGQDVSAKDGPVVFYNGTAYWDSGTTFVDAFGAVGDGVTDDSAAIQAAIDSEIPRILFNPNGRYLINSECTIASLTDGNLTDVGREIDGQGCTIIGANGIACAFRLTQAVSPNNHKYTKFHDFLFDGTVTDAFVLFETGYSWANQFYNIRAANTASSTSIVKFHNVESASFPGNFHVHDIYGNGQMYTILFSKATGASGNFDDFHVYNILGGAYIEHAAAIRISAGCNVQYSHFHDILSGGPHAINGTDADLVRCHIHRVYLEIPVDAALLPTAFDDNWGVSGTLSDCTVHDIWGAFDNRTDNPGMRIIYAHVYRTTVWNVGMYCTADYAAGTNDAAHPYVVTYYPAIYLFAGNNFTFDFPMEWLANGVYLGTITSATYLGGVYPQIENVTNTLNAAICRNALISNYGQGVDATITLPTAARGMHIRFALMETGCAYHIKAAAGNKIRLDGVMLDDGDKVSNASTAAGDSIVFDTFVNGYTSGAEYDYDWIARSEGGTWTDGGA